ncbi:unnamed protein product [Pleuronectes platessa]|uniref:Uncharacterized protein n=1 Tax=Pleuronectes platessa TaxID=8262 RepID=A0A9N7TKM0_PLEPL|nr:unnamed protein product [Pleuronectes platessa]
MKLRDMRHEGQIASVQLGLQSPAGPLVPSWTHLSQPAALRGSLRKTGRPTVQLAGLEHSAAHQNRSPLCLLSFCTRPIPLRSERHPAPFHLAFEEPGCWDRPEPRKGQTKWALIPGRSARDDVKGPGAVHCERAAAFCLVSGIERFQGRAPARSGLTRAQLKRKSGKRLCLTSDSRVHFQFNA